MEKEFVPYQESLELKELGFDETCFGKWLSSLQSNWKEYELILEMGMNEEFEDNRNIHLLEGACSAPLYQQAFRWFREKYKLDSMVQPTYSTKYQYRMFHIEGKTKVQIYGEYMGKEYKTYEEAELDCLKKLIQIVKEKL